ncbi:MarR family winged helix-turn-helix transcriptional regulator [Sporosarcina ureae]|uniref:MarR family winged helix-turn-helix transcriptional regulator n=1 Tax=Sporosarcina ureae TaxID=1571 RepID=UPI0028A9C641|nr:MarR family transcriptional regulator [Sporosarcina ureae]
MIENDVYRREDLPGFIINQTAKLITDLLHKNFILANQEITPEQWIILDELWSNDGLTQLKIAQATFRQQTSTSRIIDNLVKRDLVYRSQNPLDKRSNLIYLTKRGKELHQSLIKTIKQTMAHAVSEINEDELNNCLQVLNKILATISNK